MLANAFVNFWVDFFERGGPFMVPLAACAVAAVIVSILRVRALRREKILPRFLRAAIEKLPPRSEVGHLWSLVELDPNAALAKITRAGLQHLGQPREENAEAIQTAARREIVRLESGLAALELIVGISPLLGLLGAITGLVRVFSELGTGTETTIDTGGIALGIAEALDTTIFGLAIAIPTLVLYTYFARRVETLVVEMETLLASFVAKCYPDGDPSQQDVFEPEASALYDPAASEALAAVPQGS